ncbi:MAG: hypothetical protein CR975_07465 [Gammaproteobacteria bacterium]|nr:MAG: hypothetical protein CR975_07465 [Gammaproteobacteria bacterium]
MDKHPHLFKRLIKNNIFRLSVLYSLLFLIASLAMLGVAYVTIDKNIEASIEKEVNAEISRFIGSYQSLQLGIETEPYAFFIEHAGRKVAGNIEEIPVLAELKKAPDDNTDLLQIAAKKVVTNDSSIEQKGNILGKTVTLPDRTKLFIGKNSYDATERREDILDALSTALLALLVFGFLGGLLVSFQSIKRIDRIARVSQSIVAGNLDLRVPPSRQHDDIADLGRGLNNMLDKIDDLMQNARQVSNNIAHDLRTPLTRLRANIETIARKSDGEIRQEAEKALVETDNLLNTFTSLLRIAHVESGTAEILKQEVNLSNLIMEIMDFYDVLAEEKAQKVNLNLAPNIIVIGDKTLLSQAIVNLFTNAVKYTPEKGRILITLETVAKNQTAQLTLHDSGSGVPEEDIDKLTQRFYRLEKHRDTANGNGLGLSMVKAILDAHHGELQFVNDVGLKAIVRLPIPTGKSSKNHKGKISAQTANSPPAAADGAST